MRGSYICSMCNYHCSTTSSKHKGWILCLFFDSDLHVLYLRIEVIKLLVILMNSQNSLLLLNEIYTNGYTEYILDILSCLAVISGICVIISKNPIVSVLHLIALFANVSFYLIIIGLNFIGLSYLIVYIGAVKERILIFKEVAALVKIQLYKVFLIVIKLFQFANSEFYRRFINVPEGLNNRLTTGFSLRRSTNIFKMNVFRSYSTQSCSEDFYK